MQKRMISPITRKLTVYTKTQQILTCGRFDYDMALLRDQYNEAFYAEGVDAQVEEARMIQSFNQSNLIMDTWVAGAGPISTVTAFLVIMIIASITASIVIILSAAVSFVERVFPKPKFYAPPKTGEEAVVFVDYTAYLTYMQNVYNPQFGKPNTCPYCGQGFATEAEMLEHMENCAWKEGPPSVDRWPWWLPVAIAAGGIAAVIFVVPKIIDLVGKRLK